MPPRQSPPGRGGKPRRIHFTWTGTDAGKQWSAYIAGPAMWFECHTTGKTKPCLHEITDGELVCPMCDSVKPTEQIGYLPLYREQDGKPVCVLVHENVREVVDSLRYPMRVVVGRGPDKTDGVYVRRAMDKGTPYSSTLPERQKAADIWPTLVRMWKIPALLEWDARQNAGQAGGVLHPSVKPPTVPTVPTVPAVGKAVAAEQPVSAILGRLLDLAKGSEQRADDRTALDRPDRPDGSG